VDIAEQLLGVTVPRLRKPAPEYTASITIYLGQGS